MRTTVTIDDDVAALIEEERRRTGETFRQTLNRLLRRAVERPAAPEDVVQLPIFEGKPRIDVTDGSAALSALDDEKVVERGAL